MKFKEFIDKIEKEYFIDGEQNEQFWDNDSGYMQLLIEDKMSLPERLVLEKVRAKKKLKKSEIKKYKDMFKPKYIRRETEYIRREKDDNLINE